MNKLLAFLMALTIISQAFSLQCSKSSVFRCDDRDSCCPGRFAGHWRCCNGNQATCCKDAISCCPGGTECDLYNHRCVPKKGSLAFLSTENLSKEPFTLSTPAKESEYGFSFPDISKIMNCMMAIALQAPDTYKDVIEIIELFKKKKFLEVLLKLKDLSGPAKDLYKQCK